MLAFCSQVHRCSDPILCFKKGFVTKRLDPFWFFCLFPQSAIGQPQRLTTQDLVSALASTGLFGAARVRRVRHVLRIEERRLYAAIRRRYASTLHSADDQEIEDGIKEMQDR